MKHLIALLLCAASLGAQAKIPTDYNAIVVNAVSSETETLFDITAAVERATRENKPMFVYMGAHDCPPCQDYERFLRRNWDALHASFDQVVVVDLRTALNSKRAIFIIGDKRYTYSQFLNLIGDSVTAHFYPRYWFITPQLRQVKQAPRNLRNFQNVETHLEFLKLPAAGS